MKTIEGPELSSRASVAFRLWHPREDRMAYFPATRAVTVAGMIRHATAMAARASGWPESKIAQFILGHRENPADALPRFAYLPLPTIEPRPRDVVGGIRRVLIAEPIGAAAEHVGWLERMMSGQIVTNDAGEEVAFLERISADGVVRRYVEAATTWASVTPVALPGSDDGKPSKADKLIAKMFSHAGYALSALADLDFRRVPFVRGGEDAMRYRPNGEHYLAGCTMYHMHIRWKQAMPGPIALGSGRFCGLGVFAAIE
jgi:CRISPR-associated protein Csb2